MGEKMSYCVECGVKLVPPQSSCPLCQTPVVHPGRKEEAEAPPLFPPMQRLSEGARRAQRNTILGIVAILLLLPASITAICNLTINDALTWARFPLLSIGLLYVFVFPPYLIRRHPLRLCIPLDGLALSLALYLVCRWTGGEWFFIFALPVALVGTALAGAAIYIVRHSPWRLLSNVAVILSVTGLFTLFMEWAVNGAFYPERPIRWAWYCVAPCLLLAAALAILNRNNAVKAKLRRKLFF